MTPADFDFELPPELVASRPVDPRDASRLLHISANEADNPIHEFRELPNLLRAGDLLVVNDTRVLPARLKGRRVPGGGQVELLLVEPAGADYLALARPAKKLKVGGAIQVGDAELTVQEKLPDGWVRLSYDGDFVSLAQTEGALPLPPYLGREADETDNTSYQTVFHRPEATGSVAAPTAGLHFSQDVLQALAVAGIQRVPLTLNVGPGTFLPVRVDRIEDHRMHSEAFEIPSATCEAIHKTRQDGGRIIAVGTTVARVLESVGPEPEPQAGRTDIFIRPGHSFVGLDGLITNFHLPRSTLLMLVCALGGQQRVLSAYRHAVQHKLRFYSYGDAMLLL